ncbi:MAG: hypothetical protein AB1847_02750 [bacterium]
MMAERAPCIRAMYATKAISMKRLDPGCQRDSLFLVNDERERE